MKILSWNILQGGGKRVQQVADAIIAHDPDIVCLSEFRNNDHGMFLRTKLLPLGYRHQFTTSAPKSSNAVFLASKIQGTSRLFVEELGDYQHQLIELETEKFSIFSLYAPHKVKDIPHFKVILNLMKTREKPCIFAGDFNSGINHVDQVGKSFWHSQYWDYFKNAGYGSSFRLKHPEGREYSWFSHKGNGFRYDHIVIPEEWTDLIEDSWFSQEERLAKYSDHTPQILELHL